MFLATIYGVFRGEDMGELKEALARCRTDWIVWAAGCVLAFLVCDSLDMWLMLDSFGMGLGPVTCFLSSCVGFFFCAITPSASGGQPMQVYYLRKKGIPASVTSVILLIASVAYKLTLVLAGLGLMLFGRRFLRAELGGMLFLFRLGMLLTAGWTAFLLLLLFRPKVARGIMIWGMSVLEELHLLKNREKHQASLEVAMDIYADAAEHMRKRPGLMLGVFGVTVLRRAALLSVTWCVYRALGLTGGSWPVILLMQAIISICADMLPLPGGMGISEGLFLRVFAGTFGSLALPGMVLSRGVGHYGQLIICALFTLLAVVRVNRTPKENISS